MAMQIGQEPQRVAAAAPEIERSQLSRRSVLRVAFWSSMLALLGGIGATIVNTLHPRDKDVFGGPVAVLAKDIPSPGEAPKQIMDGHCWLVNLLPDEGRVAGDSAPTDGGLLALWWKCPHLGCTVPWKESFVSPFDALKRRGMFNCNCHGSTYTKAGLVVRGPATRAMDTMAIEVGDEGIVIQTGQVVRGTNDNSRLAVPYS
jgi:cytochrome b6-f complex iron-sulfur subunit